jgi:uncharacterized protein (TIGR02569 family)
LVPAPDPDVLRAFGLAGHQPRLLPGGQGVAWQAGSVVLKPVANVAEAEWAAEVLADLPQRGFRVNRPVRSNAGTWTSTGWAAWRMLAGSSDRAGRWPAVLAAGAALHQALVGIQRPAFLAERENDWSIGDRVAWDERPLSLAHAEFSEPAERLASWVLPNSQPSQLIHGDLTNNVLFADGLAPGIIDFTPYWRPASFGLAVVVADAISWHGAGSELVDLPGLTADSRSMIARAGLYRLVTSDRAALRLGANRSSYLQQNRLAYQRICDVLEAGRR